jgi:hypothetical protein
VAAVEALNTLLESCMKSVLIPAFGLFALLSVAGCGDSASTSDNPADTMVDGKTDTGASTDDIGPADTARGMDSVQGGDAAVGKDGAEDPDTPDDIGGAGDVGGADSVPTVDGAGGTDTTMDGFEGEDAELPPVCVDVDEDGYGDACELGEDCDDDDPNNWTSCATCLDVDQDGYYAGCDAYVTISSDCDDGDETVWASCDGCGDLDGDGHFAGCDDVSANSDCDDDDPNNWVACATCTDEDLDGHFIGCDAYVTIDGSDCNDDDPNNWESCATCEDGDNDGWYGGCDAYEGVQGPDCDDSNSSEWTDCGDCEDADMDGWWTGCDDYTGVDGPDCAPSDPKHWSDCAACIDDDGDAYGVDCDLGVDCDDDDGNNWLSCATCLDADGDGYVAGCDSYDSPDAEDCDDTASWTHPAAFELLEDGVDSDCDGAELVVDDTTGLFVSPDGDDLTGTGTQAAPYATISKALTTYTLPGDHVRVFVAGGTYSETLYTPQGVALYGGFHPTTWNWAPQTLPTIVQHDGTTTPETVNFQGPALMQGLEVHGPGLHEPYTADYSKTVALVGLGAKRVADTTLLAGDANIRPVALYTSTAAVAITLVERCTIIGTSGAGQSPAAIDAAGSSHVVLVGNMINGSTAGDGFSMAGGVTLVAYANTVTVPAGMFNNHRAFKLSGAAATLVGNVIDVETGTGVQVYGAPDVLIAHNTFLVDGADFSTALVAQPSNVVVNNLVVLASGADLRGLVLTSPYVAVNNVVFDMTAAGKTFEVDAVAETAATVNACPGTCAEGAGNSEVDPLVQGDGIHLTAESPLVDNGVDPTPYGVLPWPDIDGQERPQGNGWDIGADELPAQ